MKSLKDEIRALQVRLLYHSLDLKKNLWFILLFISTKLQSTVRKFWLYYYNKIYIELHASRIQYPFQQADNFSIMIFHLL